MSTFSKHMENDPKRRYFGAPSRYRSDRFKNKDYPQTSVPNCVFVGGINFDVCENGLKSKFSAFGVVTDVKIITRGDAHSRGGGYGFVTFERDEDVQRLLARNNSYSERQQSDGSPGAGEASTIPTTSEVQYANGSPYRAHNRNGTTFFESHQSSSSELSLSNNSNGCACNSQGCYEVRRGGDNAAHTHYDSQSSGQSGSPAPSAYAGGGTPPLPPPAMHPTSPPLFEDPNHRFPVPNSPYYATSTGAQYPEGYQITAQPVVYPIQYVMQDQMPVAYMNPQQLPPQEVRYVEELGTQPGAANNACLSKECAPRDRHDYCTDPACLLQSAPAMPVPGNVGSNLLPTSAYTVVQAGVAPNGQYLYSNQQVMYTPGGPVQPNIPPFPFVPAYPPMEPEQRRAYPQELPPQQYHRVNEMEQPTRNESQDRRGYNVPPMPAPGSYSWPNMTPRPPQHYFPGYAQHTGNLFAIPKLPFVTQKYYYMPTRGNAGRNYEFSRKGQLPKTQESQGQRASGMRKNPEVDANGNITGGKDGNMVDSRAISSSQDVRLEFEHLSLND